MRLFKSHGRLVGVVASIGVAVTAWLGWLQSQPRVESAQLQQTQAIVESTHSVLSSTLANEIERLKTITTGIKESEIESRKISSEDPIVHWSHLKITNSQIQNPVETLVHPNWKRTFTSSLEQEYLDQIQNEFDLWKLRKQGTISLLFKPKSLPGKRWTSFAFLVPGFQKINGETQYEAILAMVDPKELVGGALKGAREKSYLITHNGIILAHSQASLIGQNIFKSIVFKNGISEVFKGGVNKTNQVIESQNGKSNTFLSISRPNGLPLAVVTEKQFDATQSPISVGIPIEDFKPLVFILFGIVLVAYGIKNFKNLKKSESQGRIRPEKRASAKLVGYHLPPSSGASADAPFSQSKVRRHIPKEKKKRSKTEETPKVNNQILAPDEIKDLVNSFEVNARHIQDSRIVVSMLTQTTSQITRSPVLFFRYFSERKTAVLENDWGFESQNAPVTLAFPVSDPAVTRISKVSSGQKLASLASYEPLSKIMMSRLGVAVYEAWAITSPESNHSLIGVLVILNSGVQSNQHRDSIVRMMRTTGSLNEQSPTAQS